jgi:hypothetical protein
MDTYMDFERAINAALERFWAAWDREDFGDLERWLESAERLLSGAVDHGQASAWIMHAVGDAGKQFEQIF